MAKGSKRKAEAPILPPGTYVVDNPAWDKNAPDLELAEKPKRAKQGQSSKTAHTPTHVDRKTAIGAMLLLGGMIVAGTGAGVWWMLDNSNKQAAAAKVDVEAAAEAHAETKAALAELPLEDHETAYRGHVIQTATELGIEPPSVETLLEPNAFSNPVTHGKPLVVAPGVSKQLGPLTLEVRVETLSLDRHEIRSKGEHTLLRIKNKAEHPIAYRLNVRKKSNGDCQSPVVFNYDAMVIDAGATIEVSVCSGRQSAEILDLRTLDVTPLGARWIRQIQPLAVGNTTMAGRSHKLADQDIVQCNEDAADIVRAMGDNLVKWEDVIDFYSRHDCQHYAWPSEYRLAKQALPHLPVLRTHPVTHETAQ